jgi:hypothetical protein
MPSVEDNEGIALAGVEPPEQVVIVSHLPNFSHESGPP